MSELALTLVPEGSTDQALLPILRSMVSAHVERSIRAQWPEYYPRGQPASLVERIELALELYPCDLLFVHRDADRGPRSRRVEEIRKALARSARGADVPAVCAIPVRMTEAWLLIDEAALRRAAGNPNGKQPVSLPRPRDLEGLADPKALLRHLLREASGLSGRRLDRLNEAAAVSRLAGLIEDFSPLRQLSAYQEMEQEFLALKAQLGW